MDFSSGCCTNPISHQTALLIPCTISMKIHKDLGLTSTDLGREIEKGISDPKITLQMAVLFKAPQVGKENM